MLWLRDCVFMQPLAGIVPDASRVLLELPEQCCGRFRQLGMVTDIRMVTAQLERTVTRA